MDMQQLQLRQDYAEKWKQLYWIYFAFHISIYVEFFITYLLYLLKPVAYYTWGIN